ncbi:hypothetical protein HZ326_21837, partial [Fusarium oxysporum f. sp. albedinis]
RWPCASIAAWSAACYQALCGQSVLRGFYGCSRSSKPFLGFRQGLQQNR